MRCKVFGQCGNDPIAEITDKLSSLYSNDFSANSLCTLALSLRFDFIPLRRKRRISMRYGRASIPRCQVFGQCGNDPIAEITDAMHSPETNKELAYLAPEFSLQSSRSSMRNNCLSFRCCAFFYIHPSGGGNLETGSLRNKNNLKTARKSIWYSATSAPD